MVRLVQTAQILAHVKTMVFATHPQESVSVNLDSRDQRAHKSVLPDTMARNA